MLGLSMAFETEIGVAFDQQFAVHRTVRAVTHRASFPQCLMLENKRTGLLAVTLGAILVEPRHCQSAGGLENVAAVRIVALHAVHAAFRHRMMLGQAEFRMN